MISWDKMEAALGVVANHGKEKNICIGFDGFIDSLFRVVKARTSRDAFETYSTITEFARRVANAAGRSADMELQPVSRRMGGNAPLMAEAMGGQGFSVRCIGTMGYPEPEDLFSGQNIHFTAESVAPCATCTAFEFSDGKLMFGNNQPLLDLDWESVVKVVGLENLRQWYHGCHLWAMVNWSFLMNSNEILEGLIRDVVESCREEKLFFLDLADPSGRSREDLRKLFSLMKRLEEANRVVLSMNENESVQVANALGLDAQNTTPCRLASAIREKLGIWMASIHGLDYAVAATREQSVVEEGIFVPVPTISTGGGDHFNGGFAAALACGLEPEEAAAYGNLVSSCYVSEGKSPKLQDLRRYLEKCQK